MKKRAPMDYTPSQILTALIALDVPIKGEIARNEASRVAAARIAVKLRDDREKASGDTLEGLPPVTEQSGTAAVQQDPKLCLMTALFLRINPGAPMWGYAEREKRKDAADTLLSDRAVDLSYRVNAALDIIRAHYARSAWVALDVHDPLSFAWHPGFDEYAAHYLHASKATSDRLFGPDVVDALVDIYPRPRKLMMESGKSYWPRPRSGES